MTEIWRAIPEYEHYEVSNFGRVKSLLKSKMRPANWILNPNVAGKGYRNVMLYKNKKGRHFYVHFLVMLAFIGPRPKGHDINHKDATKTNNCLENLEYCTKKENTNHAWRLNLTPQAPTMFGSCHPRAVIDETAARLIYDMIELGMRTKDIVFSTGIPRHTIENIKYGKCWGHLFTRPPEN